MSKDRRVSFSIENVEEKTNNIAEANKGNGNEKAHHMPNPNEDKSTGAFELELPIQMHKSKSVKPQSSAGSSSLSHGEGIIEEFWDAKLRDEFVFGQDKNP